MTTVQTPTTDARARASLSACIIARDEAQILPGCLASVAFCEEIVLVDSGSSDTTIEVARAAGARVVEHSWLGFAAQRNIALDHASGDWILEIDADERVTESLRAEIEQFLADPPSGVDLGGIPRREIFLGSALGGSAKYPKYGHRLLRRGSYRHDEARTVHEGFVPTGVVHPFAGDLIHLVATSWREAVGDAWRYARLEAGQLQSPRSLGASLKGVLARPAVKFVYRLTVDGGWRDGARGVAYIALACTTDSVVWIRHLLGRRGSELGCSGVRADEHYGSRRFHEGSLRVLAIAAGTAATSAAQTWLEAARHAGADTVLLTQRGPAASGGVRVRPLERVGPLAVIRALDAEEQLRPIDAVVAFGRRGRALLHVIPPGLRGHMPEITQETAPQSVNWRERGQQPDREPR
jgi:hypothetical protein